MPPTRRSSARTAAASASTVAKVPEAETAPKAAASATKAKSAGAKRKDATDGGSQSAADTTATATPKKRKAAKSEGGAEAQVSEAAEQATEDSSAPTSASAASKTAKRKATAGGIPESPSAPENSKVDVVAYDGCPKNVDIPADLSSIVTPRDATRTLRIAAWNIVSLKSSEPKGLTRYLEAEDADMVFLSETKVNEVPSFFLKNQYPHQTWGIGTEKKSYAGVALLSKIPPLSVTKGLPDSQGQESKARCITAEFAHCYLVGVYAVNAGEGLKTMAEKQKWSAAFQKHITSLDERKPVIWTGDLNVVLDQRDLSKAGTKWNKSPGYTQIECDFHRQLLAQHGFVDVWRDANKDVQEGHFTYYGWRGQCRVKGVGWRLDSFITSQRVRDKCSRCEIRQEVYGASDHVPIVADFDRALFEE